MSNNNTKENPQPRRMSLRRQYLDAREVVWGAREIFNHAQRRLRKAVRAANVLERQVFPRWRR